MKTTKSWSVAFPLREQRQTRYKYENDNTLKRYIPDIDEDFLSDVDKERFLDLKEWIVDNNKDDKELTTITLTKCAKAVNSLMRKPLQSYIAKGWIKKDNIWGLKLVY